MAEPAQRRDDGVGGKFYEHPTREGPDGGPALYTSVTTALGVVEKEALKHWSAKLAAKRAMDNLPMLIVAARKDSCGRSYARTGEPRCGVCSTCVQRWVEMMHHGETERRAREGSAVHDVIEHWSKTGEIGEEYFDTSAYLYEGTDGTTYQVTWEMVEPYVRRFREFIADYGLTPASWGACEATVWHHDDGWAGTLDGVLKIEPVTKLAAKLCARVRVAAGIWSGADEPVWVVFDAKTREGEDKQFYDEYALQVGGAYRHAQTMTAKQGLIEMEMLATDGAVILQLRPDGYSFEPVASDDVTYDAFLHALALYRWRSAEGVKSVQVRTFPAPAGWKWREPKANGTPPPEMMAEAAETVKPVAKKATARKTAVKKATGAPAAARTGASTGRASGATLASMQARPGATLRDEDIPY